MPTPTATLAIEHRCNQCWQINYADVSKAGNQVACEFCQAELQVPEATPDRLKEVGEIARPVQVSNEVVPENASDAELMKVVSTENHVPFAERDFCGYPSASALSRLIANFIDGCFLVLSFALGLVAVFAAGNAGLIELPSNGMSTDFDFSGMLIVYFFPIVACIVQWNLIATRGQTIGKFVTCIRIVSTSGRLPGFITGVVVRNWVRNLLCLIPFFGLLDVLFIFGSAKRCIHDYLAGTRVIQG